MKTVHHKIMIRLKKIILVLLLLGPVAHSKGQVVMSLIFGDKLNTDDIFFGLHVDYSFNNLSNVHPSTTLNRFDFGLFLTFKMKERWRLNVEMMAKYNRGASGMKPYKLGNPVLDSGYANGEFTRDIGYLALPVTMQYKLSKAFYLEAGPTVGLRINAKDKFTVALPEGESTLDRDVKSSTSSMDFGLIGGAGVLIGKAKIIAVGIRYTQGLSDVIKDMQGPQYNQSFYVYTNLPIGRAKAARKKAEKEKKQHSVQ
jgi:hypothetical protein